MKKGRQNKLNEINMKIKAQLTIDIGVYENIKPEIEIDTENLEEAVNTIHLLWDRFHKCCEGRSSVVERVRRGMPITVDEYESSVRAGEGEAINDAKKEFKRNVYAFKKQEEKDKEFFQNI
jgi:hypothetical protein